MSWKDEERAYLALLEADWNNVAGFFSDFPNQLPAAAIQRLW
jgi:hypothetical protein